MRRAGFSQSNALLAIHARRPGASKAAPPLQRPHLENQANAFPMSSPPSVPNSYWGSDTLRKDSVGWS